ncbi:hypothetical protein HY251_16095 [bacterium]|nr:hypothetical protein [bacterium]
MKCLEKDPRHRYASMADFRAALERFASGGIGTSGPAPPPEPGASARTTSPESHMTGVLEVAREIAGWDANLYRISTNICRTYPQLERIKARLDAILEDRPDFALARFHRGLVHFRRGRLDAALEDMERAIDRTGDMAGAHFELGRLHLAIYSRKHEGAHRHLTRTGVQENLEQARSHIDEAVAAFREAQLLEEDLARWQIDYARAVEKLAHGKNAACVEACDRILARDPDLEEVWKLRGDALRLGEHDLGACLESYDRAVSIRRSFHEAVFAKARALLDDGSFAETHRTIARALEICPELTDALALAARAHLLEAREGGGKASLEAGLARAREAHALDPRSYEAAVTKAELLIERGRAHGDAGDFDGALAALEGARREGECENRLDFLSATAHLERARAALDRGGDARADLDAVIARRGTESARDEHGPWNDLLEAALRERERCPKS